MDFYTELQQEVNVLLAELGKPFTVRSKGVYNQETLTYGAPKTRTVQGLVSDSSMLSNLGSLGQTDAMTAQWQGKRVLLLSASLNPKAGEDINVDGRYFSFEKIQELKPANTVLLYILEVML